MPHTSIDRFSATSVLYLLDFWCSYKFLFSLKFPADPRCLLACLPVSFLVVDNPLLACSSSELRLCCEVWLACARWIPFRGDKNNGGKKRGNVRWSALGRDIPHKMT